MLMKIGHEPSGGQIVKSQERRVFIMLSCLISSSNWIHLIICLCKTYSEFHVDSSVELTLPKLLYPPHLCVLCLHSDSTDTHLRHIKVLDKFDQYEYFMTINIFVLKGDLNGKIVVVRFFFCRVYIF